MQLSTVQIVIYKTPNNVEYKNESTEHSRENKTVPE